MASDVPFLNNSSYDNNFLYQNNKQNNNSNENNKENNDKMNLNDLNLNSNELNESIKSINKNDLNRNKLMSSIEWIKFFKKSKINLEEINKVLLSNVESIDNENIKLKEALCELIKDLKEKEKSLDESLKIISKLKENYSSLFHQYQILDKKYRKLNEENEILKNNYDISNQNRFNAEGINKKSDYLKDELNKMKNDNQLLKNNYITKTNEYIKLSKEFNEMKIITEDFKQRNLEYLNMIKDRESLIKEYNYKINDLNHELNDKNEQIKLLVKFSKNINDENKINIKEITKQACQTIKLLYNYNSQNNQLNNINENISNDNNINNIFNFIFNSDDLEDLKKNSSINNENKIFKITFKLKEAIQDNLKYDNKNNIINISKEILIDIIIKFNLLKTELYSCFLREFYFVNFLNNLIDKIKINTINYNNIRENINKLIFIKNKNKSLEKENEEIRKKLILFQKKIKELNLYIEKLKHDINFKKLRMKEKIKFIINLYQNKINRLNQDFDEMKKTNFKEIETQKKELNNKNSNFKIFQDINLLKNNNKYNNKNHKKKYFKFLKIENKISFTINNVNYNNNNMKKFEKQLFDFSQINKNNDNNKNIQLNNNSINSLSFQQKSPINNVYSNYYNNNESSNKKNNQQKTIENEKLKEEISYLKNEIKDLLLEINNQQKIISENINIKNKKINNLKNNSNICEKCQYINNLMISSNIPDSKKLIEIKNIILCSPSFDENLKNIINNIFDIIIKLLTNNYINETTIYNKTINSNNITSIPILNLDKNLENINLENKFNYSYFSELNKKIFSSSELKKYYNIYNEKTNNLDEIKININGIKFSYETTISNSINEDISFNVKNKTNIQNMYNNYKLEDTGYEYKNIRDEILRLKNEKIIIDNLIELIKNYLIINEKVFQNLSIQNKNIDTFKIYLNKIFTIFKECCYYNIDDISDNQIFHKKLIIKLFETNILHL